MATVGAYEAKTKLAELLDRVSRGERIIITRHGVPVAILQPPESDPATDIRSLLAQFRRFRKGRKVSWSLLKEWVREGREGLPLATVDAELRKAARKAGVEVLAVQRNR